jgi:hypothetical protein
MSFAALRAIFIVCASRDSRIPPHLPSITGRIPIFGYVINQSSFLFMTPFVPFFPDVRFGKFPQNDRISLR